MGNWDPSGMAIRNGQLDGHRMADGSQPAPPPLLFLPPLAVPFRARRERQLLNKAQPGHLLPARTIPPTPIHPYPHLRWGMGGTAIIDGRAEEEWDGGGPG